MIAESVYARAYARALLGVARTRGDVERVKQDIAALKEQWSGSPELRRVCCSRLRSLTGKTSGLIEEIWGDTLSPTVRFFLEQLLSAGHLRLLPLVTDRFLELADRAAGRHKVEARFACDPQEGELGRVRHLITAAYGPDFTFDVRVDPALLAGVFLRIDDRVVDATLAGRLARLKRDLMKPMRPDAAVNGQNKESL